ncbi:MAG TPA: ATP-binding protein [Solirubrobacteraceae bacterium]|nr:ATP-binding protein [Solirubrobacteraceae bacterium]
MASKQSAAEPSASEPSAWWIALGGVLAGCLLSAAVNRRAARALARERRRVATDVHDLVMQDLSLALANARTLAHEHAQTPRAQLVVTASERALAGARVVIGGLTEGPATVSEPIVRAIQASAQAAARSTPLIFKAEGVPGFARPDRPTREALVHIAREAVTNATKHASANAIEVSLQYTGQWHLTVRDKGNGFDAEDGANSFGLTSMRAHVQELGGVLHISSAAEKGTTVKVVLP